MSLFPVLLSLVLAAPRPAWSASATSRRSCRGGRPRPEDYSRKGRGRRRWQRSEAPGAPRPAGSARSPRSRPAPTPRPSRSLDGLAGRLPDLAGRIHAARGRCLAALGRHAEAAAAFAAVPASSVASGDATVRRARALAAAGRTGEALTALGPLLEQPPPANPARPDPAAAALALAGELRAQATPPDAAGRPRRAAPLLGRSSHRARGARLPGRAQGPPRRGRRRARRRERGPPRRGAGGAEPERRRHRAAGAAGPRRAGPGRRPAARLPDPRGPGTGAQARPAERPGGRGAAAGRRAVRRAGDPDARPLRPRHRRPGPGLARGGHRPLPALRARAAVQLPGRRRAGGRRRAAGARRPRRRGEAGAPRGGPHPPRRRPVRRGPLPPGLAGPAGRRRGRGHARPCSPSRRSGARSTPTSTPGPPTGAPCCSRPRGRQGQAAAETHLARPHRGGAGRLLRAPLPGPAGRGGSASSSPSRCRRRPRRRGRSTPVRSATTRTSAPACCSSASASPAPPTRSCWPSTGAASPPVEASPRRRWCCWPRCWRGPATTARPTSCCAVEARAALRRPPEGKGRAVWALAYPPAYSRYVTQYAATSEVPADPAAGADARGERPRPRGRLGGRRHRADPAHAPDGAAGGAPAQAAEARPGRAHRSRRPRSGSARPTWASCSSATAARRRRPWPPTTPGKGRWAGGGPEAATPTLDEWVEEIPFDETRGYVKRVLRSDASYRLLSGRDGWPPPLRTRPGRVADAVRVSGAAVGLGRLP